ncbi:MAG: two-component sensor histidine kinase [Cellulomonas sp. 73-92]|uniref:MtrAB system histidine kinase MtrB n=1 Tax=Cellulomonas sp. 73-92 TaxID=1895740 RepID=UPI00092A2AB8|nr:MtrAB system histidine kinase MtrB [Cellulomonas sp. 73-92]OJV82098.1 MAG: two-component sensor histidine kinase [Cellulomonas sp. 73-92]
MTEGARRGRPRWTSVWRLLRSRWLRRLRDAVHWWRQSLQVRVLTSTLVIGLVALALVFVYVGQRTAAGLFDERRDQVLEESFRSSQQAQQTLSASTAQTAAEVFVLLRGVTTEQSTGGPSSPEVFMLRAPVQPTTGQPPPVQVGNTATKPALVYLISDGLKAAVADKKQHWQSVAITEEDGSTTPGIIVGQQVQVPVVGTYQLYFLYRLDAEQRRLDFLLGTLALAAGALVVLLASITWLVTLQTVRPVRRAAEVAERLADGQLTERMPVHGEDEMATLARSFNEMAASLQDQIRRLEELSALQRRFVSDVSHELRTPLTTVRMAGEMIYAARQSFDPATKRSAELLSTQLDRFEDLLADLLEISRYDAGAAVLDAEGRDVRDVVLRTVDNVVTLAARKGSWLRVDLPEGQAVADIDPRRVERVCRNLLVNAIEHAEGTPVEVRVAADAKAVAVVVRDHGIGMTPEEVAHVFDRFWRADPARARTTGGTGLGLAISLEDAHLHGGWLDAWGRPGQGASFRLTLPRRAGMRLTGSPLDLVPAPEPETVVVPAGVPRTDPAALPEWTGAFDPDRQEVP